LRQRNDGEIAAWYARHHHYLSVKRRRASV